MSVRIDYRTVAPAALKALLGLEKYLSTSGLPLALLELVRLRASLINGCAYCVDMHTKDARAAGETEQRLYAVSVFRETPYFTPRERAALEWTEALTRLAASHPSEALYREVRELFSEHEVVDLTMAIVSINAWNRMAVALGADVGSYAAAQH